MRKVFLWLIFIVLVAIGLSACDTPQPESAVLVEASNTPSPTVADTTPPTDTPEPTLTVTPEPTETPEQIDPTPTPSATITPTVEVEQPTMGSTRISEIDQMEQVFIPAGEFIMGSDDIEAQRSVENGRAYPEIPAHTVYLDDYWIDKYEVTNAQYALCVADGACTPPHSNDADVYRHYYDNPEFANYPVVWVSWFAARAYCEWAGRRLPTEAEWEKAARGTDGRKYPWGNEEVTGERANFCDVNCTRTIANELYDDGYSGTAPVGSYPAGASPYGVMDMSGNVWEWVSSLIMPYPYDANDGREDLDAPGERAWRGGPWSNGYWWMRSSVRYRSVNFYKWYVLGIRCAASP